MTLTYPATVAECLNPAMPNTDTCRTVNGATQMVVDHNDSGTNNPWFGFVSFSIDDKVANKTVTKVTLQLHTQGLRRDLAWTVTPAELRP